MPSPVWSYGWTAARSWADHRDLRNCQPITEVEMNKKIAPKDNSANMPNGNKGTLGTNPQYDQAQGNRGKQLAENKQSTHGVKPQGGMKGAGKGS
jgi:hypothetical protein